MKRCKNCQVEVLDETVTCPLCNRVLIDDGKPFQPERMYLIRKKKERGFTGLKIFFLFCLV